ncbi:PD40 domain-containing protein [Aquisphaera insulae]|uniref:PD40 domain-containing protein n=1 Tax=Aquisphaera insulae TaxID=2712864 RepID=UPI0013EC5D40|nr:PD40 domain-containing protein [Aquisphaera insulae]
MLTAMSGLLKLMTASLVASSLHSPPAWSPDGQWLAYTTATSGAAGPQAGFLVSPADDPTAPPSRRPAEGPAPAAARRYRIWAREKATGASVLVEDSKDPVTAPAWGPDGHTLCYGRLVLPIAAGPAEGRKLSLEIVVQEALDRKRVVATIPWAEREADANVAVADLEFCWNPDGQILVIPLPGPSPSLVVLLPEQGRILKTIDQAERPAWSPDGSRLAYLAPAKARAQAKSLTLVGRDLGPGSSLMEFADPCGAPFWSQDGQSILIAGRRFAMGNRGYELLRVFLETRGAVPILALGPPILGTLSTSLDRQQEQAIFTADLEGQAPAIVFGELRTGRVFKRLHPFDDGRRIGAIALHPDGQIAAVRVQTTGDSGLPLLCDLVSEEVTLLAPDASSRAEWMASMVEAARLLVKTSVPDRPGDREAMAQRPSLLPVPGEIGEQNPASLRLRRIGKIGRAFLDTPANPISDARGESAAEPTDELRLFFDYLRGDHTAAEADLDAIEGRMKSSGNRLRFLALRAQVLLARGEPQRARSVVDYLTSAAGRVRRVEETPAGFVSTDVGEPGGPLWARYLAERIDAFPAASSGGTPAEEEEAADFRLPPLMNEIPGGPIDAGAAIPFPGRNRGFVDLPIPGNDPPAVVPPFPRPLRRLRPPDLVAPPGPGPRE